jgi:hypothetical protein
MPCIYEIRVALKVNKLYFLKQNLLTDLCNVCNKFSRLLNIIYKNFSIKTFRLAATKL